MKRKKKAVSESDEKTKKALKGEGTIRGKQTIKKEIELVSKVQNLLRTQQTRLAGLTKLQNALRDSPNPDLLNSFMKQGAECQDVLQILEEGRHNLSPLEIQLCLEVLESVLLCTANENQAVTRSGMPVVQKILQNHIKVVYSSLSPGGPSEVTRAALKLLTAMVTQGAPAAREVQRTFDFTLKSLHSLVNKRDSKVVQDTRTCFLYFCLSFLVFGDVSVIKHILELKGFLQSVMKGLNRDPPAVVNSLLSTLKSQAVQNTGITKKTKVQFFNAYVLTQLAALYQYTKDNEEETQGSESSLLGQTVRQQVHEFLLVICTSFKHGVCFSNKTGAFTARSNNPVLLKFLQNMAFAAANDVLVQELVIQTLQSCQDLVKPFLSGLTATYEPRLSMPWIANMNLMTKLYVALSLPSQMLKKSGVEVTERVIPYLRAVVIPVGLERSSLSHGVQHASSLVKHTTLSLLIVILKRTQDAASHLASTVEPGRGHGHPVGESQAPVLQHFREGVLKVLPDVKTVISLRQNLFAGNTGELSNEEGVSSTVLLSETLKVIHGYQRLWPPVLSHASFDLSKLLPGQQEISDRTFPPIAQHLTLQILLQAPAGSLKWYQQKGKSGTSFVHTILNLCGSARHDIIRQEAKQLLSKLFCETGLLSEETSELDIWLTHLDSCVPHNSDSVTLPGFLDEVFTTAAAEPYIYTDVIAELQSEALEWEANEATIDKNLSTFVGAARKSLPVSPLLVRALIQYTQMASTSVESDNEETMRILACIAHYVNLVTCDILHSLTNPSVLCLAVMRYYGNAVLPAGLVGVRSTHNALLKYVKYWLRGGHRTSDKQLCASHIEHSKNLVSLRSFIRSAVTSKKEATAVVEKFQQFLEPLDETELGTVITECVEFCKQSLAGNLAPLIRLIHVKCFKITGSTSLESITPLLQSLPFSSLLWQIFGRSSEGINAEASNTSSSNFFVCDEEDIILCQDAWIQDLLMTALEKEPLSSSIPLCFHILLHLRSLIARAFTSEVQTEQDRVHSAILLGFEMLQFLLQRLIAQYSKEHSSGTTISEASSAEQDGADTLLFHHQRNYSKIFETFKVEDLFDGGRMCCTVLHHPVILQCFLWKPDASDSPALQVLRTELTYSISNLLVTVLPGLAALMKIRLLKPFVDRLCAAVKVEIDAAQKERGTVQSSELLYLYGLFHEFCSRESAIDLISSLVKLPSRLLLSADPSTGTRTPSVFLQTLLLLLDGLFRENAQASNFLKSNAEETAVLQSFHCLVGISQVMYSSQLDSAILKLLNSSQLFVLASTSDLLDSCLNNPTDSKVAIATTLIVSFATLRSHFELRCIGACRKEGIVPENGNKDFRDPIAIKAHVVEYVPLVCSYLTCVQEESVGESSETCNSRRKMVISYLFESYWTFLWKWLLGDRATWSKHVQESSVELLAALIRTCVTEKGKSLMMEAFYDLLKLASSWDGHQQRVCWELLSLLCRDYPTCHQRSELASRFCFACMESFSHALTAEGIEEQQVYCFEESLHRLALICKNDITVRTDIEGCAKIWNNFVHNILRFKFESVQVLRTLILLVKSLYQEEACGEGLPADLMSLETVYEMLLNHSQFLDVMLGKEQTDKTDLKEALVELLIAIVELRGSCCKSSHLSVLLASYSASLCLTDQYLLHLMQLYERNHSSFGSNRPFLWGTVVVSHQQTIKGLGPSLWKQPSVSEVLELVEKSKMTRSAVLFPQSRSLQLPKIQKELHCEEDIYDPCFLLPVFSCLLAPNHEVDCRKFVERGCVGFTVASLSSSDMHVRHAGYHVLTRFMTHLEGARFKERKQIFHLLSCLRNGITELNCRLSSVMVCFVSRAAHILLRPEHSLYVMINSFLLQRPVIDVRDVPLFYNTFNSSSMQHVAERSWMLQLLVDGMKDSPDYYLYKRRHVIELALSYHDSQASEHHSRNLVTQLLLSALKIHPAAYDLAKNYGVIAWIHSLCLKSPSNRSACLNLLWTLWFTLEQRKPDPDCSDPSEQTEKQPVVRLPPNVAQECVLVSWSLLDKLRLNPAVNDTTLYFQTLASIIPYLSANQQYCGMSCDRVLSLIRLWCETFGETALLNHVMSSVNMGPTVHSSNKDKEACSKADRAKRKTDSLSCLFVVLTAWQPPSGVGTKQCSYHKTVLLIWRFFLRCFFESPLPNKAFKGLTSHSQLCPDSVPTTGASNSVPFIRVKSCLARSLFTDSSSRTPTFARKPFEDLPSVGEPPNSHLLHSVLRWFSRCLVTDCTLPENLVKDSALEIRHVLQLYKVNWDHEKPVLPETTGPFNQPVKANYCSIRELNLICLILLAAVQRIVRLKNQVNLPTVCKLVSEEPYSTIIDGMEKVVFPLFSHPNDDVAEESSHEGDIVVQQLVSLFVQELWFKRAVPLHFLLFLLSESGNTHVDQLIEALDGKDVIAQWVSKKSRNS